jgi:hypothetical protein
MIYTVVCTRVSMSSGYSTPRGPPKWRLSDFNNFALYSITLHPYYTMPGIGPSLVFVAGLAVGVGAGSFIPKKSTKEIGVLPPPPVEKYDVVKRLPTATGSVVLQGGFPGTSSPILSSRNRADKKGQHPISSRE